MRQTNHYVQFLHFDVDGIVILDEEYFHLLFQDIGSEQKRILKNDSGRVEKKRARVPLLNDEVNVAKSDVLDLGLGREESNHRGRELFDQLSDEIGVARKQVDELHQHLHSRQHDGGVRVRQSRRDSFADAKRFIIIHSVTMPSSHCYFCASRSSFGS